MNNKYIAIAAVILIVAAGAYAFSKKGAYQAPAQTQSGNAAPSAADVVTYTDGGFSPAVLTVKKGTTVTFVNRSSDPFRPASNPHPIHTLYPESGGCVSSAFDACKDVASGDSWSFTFNDVGTWGYHNHLSPGNTGTIVVQ